jgi:hypothetical protein
MVIPETKAFQKPVGHLEAFGGLADDGLEIVVTSRGGHVPAIEGHL